jgi:hypothetical protein
MNRFSLTKVVCSGAVIAYLLACAGIASADAPAKTRRMAWAITYPSSVECSLTPRTTLERSGYRVEIQSVTCKANGVLVVDSDVACDAEGSVSRYLDSTVTVRCSATK